MNISPDVSYNTAFRLMKCYCRRVNIVYAEIISIFRLVLVYLLIKLVSGIRNRSVIWCIIYY